MKKCPRCKKEFTRDLQFCSVCGYRDEKNIATNEFYICPKCKIEYSYKIDHCTHCGYSTDKYKEEMKSLQSEEASVENRYIPKCPTCNSPNIKKISSSRKLAGAIGFGLLSKTAKSQFECNDCGYKW